MRKRMIIRIILIVILIIIGIILYITGKEHKVFIDNREISLNENTYFADKNFKIWFDNQDVGVGEKGKKILVKVGGIQHKIIIAEIRDDTLIGERYEKQFKLKINENATISIPLMIHNSDHWIVKQENE